eukprot:gene25576-32046_t
MEASGQLGMTVYGAGDVNGDGLSDILVAASAADSAVGTGAGSVYVIYGRTDTTIVQVSDLSTKQQGFVINGGCASEALGNSGVAGITTGEALRNIEKIDLTGTGNNTLKLSLTDMLEHANSSNVFNASNTTSGLSAQVARNQLMVDGDAGDKLVLSDLTNWTASATKVVAGSDSYTAYNHNTSAAQLLVDDLVVVSQV